MYLVSAGGSRDVSVLTMMMTPMILTCRFGRVPGVGCRLGGSGVLCGPFCLSFIISWFLMDRVGVVYLFFGDRA